MKIGIMTFWWSEDNYGQLLQCYALQKYLRDQGHDAYLIRYDPRNDYVKSPLFIKIVKALNPIKLFKYLKQRSNEKKSLLEQTKNPRNFKDFRNEYIIQSINTYTTFDELKKNPPDADVYIVGSDQVWNFNNTPVKRCRNIIHAYFLDFGKETTKRISYAASWSINSLPKDISEEIKPLLNKMDYVSVREKNGIDICTKLGVIAEWVCDPTFLLSAEIYRDLSNKVIISKNKKPYLFLYILGNESEYSINDIFRWAKTKDLDIIYISGNSNIDSHEKIYASIQQWLFLLDNAEYVITNSFHCCVFSIIFHKQFAAIPLKGSITGMNTRLESLWELTKIEKRYLVHRDFSVLDIKYSIDFHQTSNFLEYL